MLQCDSKGNIFFDFIKKKTANDWQIITKVCDLSGQQQNTATDQTVRKRMMQLGFGDFCFFSCVSWKIYLILRVKCVGLQALFRCESVCITRHRNR